MKEGADFFERLRAELQKAPPKSIESGGMLLKEAAVLAPLFWRGDEPWVYLTMRPLTMRKHPGQISFPGGARDPDDLTPLHTALREADEELGIPPDQVEVLGMLAGMPSITSYYVTPFVGVVPASLKLRPNPEEVGELIEAPLLRLRAEKRVFYEADRDVFVWDDAQHVVWGLTWRFVRELAEHARAAAR
ncbi:MAG: hydrolase, family [Myxococcaceae bacterium]|nr:hydrolase, family [Myxococcaceae bacterium]